jgi:hypothetical protein
MKRWLVVLAVIVCARRAGADPTLVVDEAELKAGLDALAEQLDEPVGMLAIARNPKLGLEKNDIVRAINGEAASKSGMRGLRHDTASELYLDVLRGKKEVVIRLKVKFGPIEDHVERDRFKEELDRMKQYSFAWLQVTKDGNPSGVEMKMPWFVMMSGPTEGDIIRRVDRKTTETIDELLAALDAAKDNAKVVLEIDRLGQMLTYTLIFDDPPKEDPAIAAAIAAIVKIDDATYEVPRSLVDAVISDPTKLAKGARVVPAMKNGVPDGFKLYAIRPSSVVSALGFTNGDTVQTIAGLAPDKTTDIAARVKKAKVVKIEITRRGQALTLEYRLR